MKKAALNFNDLPGYNQSFSTLFLLFYIEYFRPLHLRAQCAASLCTECCIILRRVLHLRAQSAASLNANFRIIQPRLLQHQTPIPVSNNKGSGNFLIKSSQTKPSLGLTNGKITA